MGARLAVSGLAVAYSKPYKYQGPQPSAFFIDIGFFTLGIEFDNRTTEIQVRNKDGFEVSLFCDYVIEMSKMDSTSKIYT